MSKNNFSKNEKAEKIMGRRREETQPILSAWELGYVCPICHITPDIENDICNEEKLIHFSEYNGFLWCPECDIDIPFAFCFEEYFKDIRKNKNDREWINVAIDRFLEFVEELKKEKEKD